MSQKTLILLITLFILIIGGLLGFYYYYFSVDSNTSNTPTTRPSIFPIFGTRQDPVRPAPQATSSPDTTIRDNNIVVIIPQLRQITKSPVAGSTSFVTASSATSSIIRYTDRASGNIFETRTNILNVERITNVTIPKVFEALWGTQGKNVIVRYLTDNTEIIQSYATEIKAPTGSSTLSTLEGNFLPLGIKALARSNDKLLYIDDNGGFSRVISATVTGAQKKELFKTALQAITLAWPEENTIVITTKATAKLLGYTYFTSPQTGTLTNVLGGVPGLSVLVNKNKNILFAGSRDQKIHTRYYNFQKEESVATPFRTLPEKCVWSLKKQNIAYCGVPTSLTDGDYPDVWYQGKVSFEDELWKYDGNTGQAELIMSPEIISDTSFDMINLQLTPAEDHIIFTNKRDLSLWIYRFE